MEQAQALELERHWREGALRRPQARQSVVEVVFDGVDLDRRRTPLPPPVGVRPRPSALDPFSRPPFDWVGPSLAVTPSFSRSV